MRRDKKRWEEKRREEKRREEKRREEKRREEKRREENFIYTQFFHQSIKLLPNYRKINNILNKN